MRLKSIATWCANPNPCARECLEGEISKSPLKRNIELPVSRFTSQSSRGWHANSIATSMSLEQFVFDNRAMKNNSRLMFSPMRRHIYKMYPFPAFRSFTNGVGSILLGLAMAIACLIIKVLLWIKRSTLQITIRPTSKIL